MAYTTIDKPTDYFNTVIYTGNGNDNHSITGVGFQADFIWVKARSATKEHRLQNSVAGITNHMRSNATNAESGGSVKTVDSDGFTLGTSLSWNQNTTTYASWNWLAGGSASSNSDGSITSSVSANTTAGFSIVSFTGTGSDATVGHGLNVAPDMVIVKSRDAVRNWGVYHRSLGGDDSLKLNLTDATTTSLDCWNDLDPTSSVVHLGTTGGTNVSGEDAIMYCFHSVKGYNKFGSYTGNGNTDGPFIYTGFKPAFVIVKNTVTSPTDWIMIDNKRLYPNLTLAEESQAYDLFSNGFKATTTSGNNNASGQTYIYMAFAESPFVSSGGIPTTAK